MSRARDLGSLINSTAAGKNLAINGAFDFWQRGTSFSNPSGSYTADRFAFAYAGSPTFTISRQSFVAGDEPNASIAGKYYLQNATTVSGGSITDWYHRIEDVSLLAGKTITISFYARATIGTATLQLVISQYNGSTYTDTTVSEYPQFVAGAGWRRYSATVTLPNISRSSIVGSNHHTNIIMRHHHSVTTYGVWGFQVEIGSSATPFSRAGGNLDGELAACQRYFYTSTMEKAIGSGRDNTLAFFTKHFPVSMRATPSFSHNVSIKTSSGSFPGTVGQIGLYGNGWIATNATALSCNDDGSSVDSGTFYITGYAVSTGQTIALQSNNLTNFYWAAEL